MPADALQRLEAAGPPIATDAWSLGNEPLRIVLAAIDAGARTIVECGSGRSTVLIARRLAELGEGTVRSLEHDRGWAKRTRALLAAEGLERATVITAPLEPHPLVGPTGGWYSPAALGPLPIGIDLLLIDGPPAGDPDLRRSRHPALDELGRRLAPGATVILDDATREGERLALARWERELGLEFAVDQAANVAIGHWAGVGCGPSHANDLGEN